MNSSLAPLAVAVPMVAAAVCTIVGKRVHRSVLGSIALVAAAFETIAGASLARDAATHATVIHWFGGWHPSHGVSLGIAFVVDPAGGSLAALAGFLTTMALLFAWTFYRDDDGAFHALMLVFSAALVGFFLTGDIFNLFVFFELMSVSAYALTGYRSEDSAAVQGALSFAVVNSVGAFLMLTGIALVYARTGALTMAQIAHTLGTTADPLVVVAFALITLGFCVKAAIVPFHFWLSEAHAVAPTPLCVLFSGIMVEAGLYAVARVYWSVFSGALGPEHVAVRDVLLVFGIFTAVVGAIMCFAQRHLKRLLAFSTIAHSGIMLCALGLLQTDALGGFLVYVLGHGLLKGGLFFGSGIIFNRYRSVDVEELRGRLRELPWLPAALGIGALGLAGIPPFGTFLGKTMIDDAATHVHLGWIGWILLAASALTGAAVLNALGRMTFGWGPPPDPRAFAPRVEEPETDPAQGSSLAVMAAPMFVVFVLALGTGMFGRVASTATAAAARFMDLGEQERLVLTASAGAPLAASPPVDMAEGITRGLLAAALAIVIASIGLFGHRMTLWPTLKRSYDVAMRLPHAWHSGILTDYITWLVTGSAVFGGLLLMLTR